MTDLVSLRRRTALVAAAMLASSLVTAGASTSSHAATFLQEIADADFRPIGTFGAYRLDGVRDGLHEGVRVRFVDMTLHNRSTETTFPETIQTVWWQGRNTGDKVPARFRDLKRFGMYDFVKPGTTVAVTYIMPVRPDIDGIRVDYMKAPKGQQERRWTWDELVGGGPGTLYHKGRPVGAAVPSQAAPRQGATPQGNAVDTLKGFLRKKVPAAPLFQSAIDRNLRP